jgi:very-short-patch-repair endonuclease
MNKGYIDYNKDLKSNSRLLRNNSTLSEISLWQKLRGGKMMGFKFNRQKPLGNYIVDFYCKKLNLEVKIDGNSHDNKYMKDLIRQGNLEQMCLTVIRLRIYR